MGDEFLPPLRNGEAEIARISLQSVTCDQISVRARRSGKRTIYSILDEYESFMGTNAIALGQRCGVAFTTLQ